MLCFQMPEKGFMPKAFLRFKFLVGKLPFSLKLHYFKGGRFYQCVITINSSLVLFTKYVSMFIIFWSKYQRYTLPLSCVMKDTILMKIL